MQTERYNAEFYPDNCVYETCVCGDDPGFFQTLSFSPLIAASGGVRMKNRCNFAVNIAAYEQLKGI